MSIDVDLSLAAKEKKTCGSLEASKLSGFSLTIVTVVESGPALVARAAMHGSEAI